MNKNKKDAEAVAHFLIKAAKLVQVIIILRKFVMEKSFFVISSLLDIHSSFTCSIIAFRAIDYPSPVCQHATFIYCAKYVNTYTGKSFCCHTGVGEQGGRYAIKLFLISIYYLVKIQFLPKIKSL